ncbi:glycoside hydrolase domain-containing protein [Desertibacillus haloalkaliphilus]|uniref:glycoside hydrolase domain-containing protein n=1 Tax=Desertibacillus haloalkaliphilus TaxID=1328930 RepID=UPI0028A8CBC9|nr:glycoside hydrolase domain-containing protein [Desertibacillus haloalkaliphilus]
MNFTKQFWVLTLSFIVGIATFFLFVVFDKDEELGSEQPINEEESVVDDEQPQETTDDRDQGTDQENQEEQSHNDQTQPARGDTNEDVEFIWGVDSASRTTEDFYQCVTTNFGEPEIWGRYLGDKEGVSYGLTTDEINLLHDQRIQILVIYNHFTDGTTYERGVQEAEQAIALANELSIPEGVALFANVEPEYPIDADFITGWYDTLAESVYEAGIYGDFSEDGDIHHAFQQAASEQAEIQDHTVIWTHQPQIGITTEENAPEYQPAAPEGSLAWGWQYGIESEACNIDTNLFSSELVDYLW